MAFFLKWIIQNIFLERRGKTNKKLNPLIIWETVSNHTQVSLSWIKKIVLNDLSKSWRWTNMG